MFFYLLSDFFYDNCLIIVYQNCKFDKGLKKGWWSQYIFWKIPHIFAHSEDKLTRNHAVLTRKVFAKEGQKTSWLNDK